MDDNQFLDKYKKKLDEGGAAPTPKTGDSHTSSQDMPAAKHYEEKSTFVPPRPIKISAPGDNRRNKKILPIILAAVLLVALVIFLVWFFNRGFSVIDLRGYTLSEAQIWAGEKDIRLQVSQQYNDDYAVDLIIDQDPIAGTMIKRGEFLRITVSQGHDLSVTLPLPDLLKMTMAEVETWAAENYMSRVRITSEFSSTIPSGRVIRFEVNDNTVVDMVRRSSPVYVIVSRGPEPQSSEPVTVPDFTTMTLAQAQQFADEKDIELVVVESYHDQFPKGAIIEQSIAPNQIVDSGSVIRLTVSLGRKIVIPNFSGYTRERASTVAAELGIPIQISERFSSRAADRFVSQSLTAGTTYQAGDFLELIYSLGNQVIVPGFTGQPLSAIESWANQYNQQGASIRISVTRTQNNAPRDTILYQDKANTSVAIDVTIRITASLGRKVFVPDLIAPEGSGYDLAMSRDKATEICESLGLIVVFVEEQKDGRLPGEVWHQSAAPGSELYEGSTITLKYNPVNATLVMPNFSGKTVQKILEEGWMKKLTITFVEAGYVVEGYEGAVFEQTLPAGRIFAFGSEITLMVSDPKSVQTSETTSETTSGTTSGTTSEE